MSIPANAQSLVKAFYDRHGRRDLAAVDSVRNEARSVHTHVYIYISSIPELRNIPRSGKSFFNNCSPPRTAKCYREGDREKNARLDVCLWKFVTSAYRPPDRLIVR